MIIAGILRSGVLVFAATQVSSSAGGVLAIVIIITGAGWIGSAIGIPMILSSVCGDHLDNRSDHRRGGHLSGLTRPGGSPSSDHPESVDHHIACLDTGSARRGPSVGWVVDPTCRALGRRQMGAWARAGVAGGPCGPKRVGARLPSALVRHSPYGEDLPRRGKVRLRKAIGDGHVLRVDAG